MPSDTSPRIAWSTWLGIAAVLVLAWCAYHPGLSGGFVFDDFVNLDALGATGRVDNLAAFVRYITSGTADPTGRPLALLTFLVDGRDWPTDARPFLRTNVLLHLFNAALLFALLRVLGRDLGFEPDGSGNCRPTAPGVARRVDVAAFVGAGLWALHPLFVSTTLYAIQREAMLAATFTLLGLLAWARGRNLIAHFPLAGAAWMLGGIGFGTLFALLCKANGALLPLLAWMLDVTIYRDRGQTAVSMRLRWLLLVLPGVLVCVYVLSYIGQWSHALEFRPWTVRQRVLTEPRVLLDYLRLLVVPRVLSTGLYNDDYAWSTSLLHPWTTLPSLLGVIALVATGFAVRRRHPALAAAMLFYFAGQLLESTTVPLELYFEHRNYLPALLLGWPVARAIVGWRSPVALRAIVAVALLGLLAATTWQRASLWADQPRMAGLWAATNPGSSRAVVTQALFDIEGNQPELALAILAGPWQQRPDDLQLALTYVNAACLAGGPTSKVIDKVAIALRNAHEGEQLLFRWLRDALTVAQSGGCRGVSIDTIGQWTRAALANAKFNATPGRLQDLHAILGQVALARGDAIGALQEFEQALDVFPTPAAAARQSAWLAAAGHPAEGLALLDHYGTVESRRDRPRGWNMSHLHQRVLERQGYWPHEFAELRRKMHQDLAATRGEP